MMEVFLVPVGCERYELYCEVVDEPPAVEDGDAPPRGIVRRLGRQFRELLAAAERHRRQRADRRDSAGREHAEAGGWTRRLKGRALRWIAESVAEQRLLWHLRRQASAALVYPADLPESQARQIVRGALRRDFERHRFWLAVDAMAFAAAGLLVILPGPNLVAYYFLFRLVGHYLSMRGARQGLDRVAWRVAPCAALTELRELTGVPGVEREQRLLDVATRLKLQHLAAFFERTAVYTR
jgi:hypothetical protein